MKKFIAFLVAAVMVLSIVPTSVFSADEKLAVVKSTVEYYDLINSGENYFAADKTLFDKDGNVVWQVQNDNETIYTMTDNCIITVWVNGSTVEDAEYGFNLYKLANGKVSFKSAFENYPYISHYDGNDYTVVTHIDILKIKRESITYNGKNLSALPLYGYDIIDKNGDIVYSETGKKAIFCFKDNYFCELVGIEGVTNKYNVFELTDSDIKKTQIDYTCIGITEAGHFLISHKAGTYDPTVKGLINHDGKIIVPLNYDKIDFVNGYYLASKNSPQMTDVYDTAGNEIYFADGEIRYYNEKVAVISFKTPQDYGFRLSAVLLDIVNDTVITEGYTISFCEDYFVCDLTSSNNSGIKVYDTDGNLIFDKDLWEYQKIDNGNNSFIVLDPVKQVYLRLDSLFNIVETLPGDVSVISSYNGVSVLKIKDTSKNYLMYKGKRISDNHGSYILTENMPTIAGGGVHIFQDSNGVDAPRYIAYLINSDNIPFYDVYEESWEGAYVNRCFKEGIMIGVGDNKFGPLMSVSRAQVLTTIWRLAGEPAPESENPFVDTPDGMWYTEAVTWAAECGITTGIGGNYFAPDRTITRGEVAAIFYRYAAFKGDDISAKVNLSSFTDPDKLSDWNRDAFAWCVSKGIINGKTKDEGHPVSLAPFDVLTRAELAAILCRYGI